MLVVKYPNEIKAIANDPNTAIYTDPERHEHAKVLIAQARKRRDRGIVLDLVSIRTNLKDRTQSESIDRPESIDEIIKRREQMMRSGSVSVSSAPSAIRIPSLPLASVQKNPIDSPFSVSARSYDESAERSSVAPASASGSRSSRGTSGSIRQIVFGKRLSAKKSQSSDQGPGNEFAHVADDGMGPRMRKNSRYFVSSLICLSLLIYSFIYSSLGDCLHLLY